MTARLLHKQLQPSLRYNNTATGYEKLTYSGSNVTDIVTWTDSGMTQKIQEENYVYISGKVSTKTSKQYDEGGVLVQTLTETYTFAGSKLDFKDKVLT